MIHPMLYVAQSPEFLAFCLGAACVAFLALLIAER